MNTPKLGDKTNILLFGETGNWKYSLGNKIQWYNTFYESSDVKSETKITYGCRGTGVNKDIFIFDTPNLQDTSGDDKEHMIQMVNYIKKQKQLNAIIVVFKFQQVWFPYNMQTMLKLFCNIFPMKDPWKHIVLIFTNAFSRRGALTQEQKEKRLRRYFQNLKK